MISSQERPRKSRRPGGKTEKLCWGHTEREGALEYPNQILDSYFLDVGRCPNLGRPERARS